MGKCFMRSDKMFIPEKEVISTFENNLSIELLKKTNGKLSLSVASKLSKLLISKVEFNDPLYIHSFKKK